MNYLSHFLLVRELLQQSQYTTKKIQPRCVFLTSLTHYCATLAKDLQPGGGDLQGTQSYDPFKQYANSKLCQLIAAKEFHRRMNAPLDDASSSSSSSNYPKGAAVAVHPGIVDTELARGFFNNGIPKLLHPVLMPFLERVVYPIFLKTPKAAAECVLYACTAPGDVVGGKYVVEGRVAKSSAASDDVLLAHRLWEKSEELVETGRG